MIFNLITLRRFHWNNIAPLFDFKNETLHYVELQNISVDPIFQNSTNLNSCQSFSLFIGRKIFPPFRLCLTFHFP